MFTIGVSVPVIVDYTEPPSRDLLVFLLAVEGLGLGLRRMHSDGSSMPMRSLL